MRRGHADQCSLVILTCHVPFASDRDGCLRKAVEYLDHLTDPTPLALREALARAPVELPGALLEDAQHFGGRAGPCPLEPTLQEPRAQLELDAQRDAGGAAAILLESPQQVEMTEAAVIRCDIDVLGSVHAGRGSKLHAHRPEADHLFGIADLGLTAVDSGRDPAGEVLRIALEVRRKIKQGDGRIRE